MEQENIELESKPKSLLFTATPFSKYLALTLFVLMPFIGGWVGYTYAPVKTVEVEKIIVKEIPTPQETPVLATEERSNIPLGWEVLRSEEYAFEIGYPTDYIMTAETREGMTTNNYWKIYQNVQLPQGHSPKTVYVEMIDPNTISQGDLSGGYTAYDAEYGFCYNTYSDAININENVRWYQTKTINGYVVCRHSVGDAGIFGSSIIFIYPDKIHALKISTGGDQYQESAPLDDFANTVRLLGPQPEVQKLPSHLQEQYRG